MPFANMRLADSSPAHTNLPSQPHPGDPRKATEHEVARLSQALAEAFMEDPVFSWLMPSKQRRRGRLRRFFAFELRHLVLPRGAAWTVDGLNGAALVLPPKAWSSPPRLVMLQGLCFGARVDRPAGLLAQIERRHLREPHYYFAYIGVSPAAQGQGLGSRLMSPTLERCDAEGLPAYLEASSERNAALYERLGFELQQEIRFAGSPPLRLMVRPPK
ncbi:MAG: GNAT family N-acetyltransferase [Solirubrobacteraceae bacterium]